MIHAIMAIYTNLSKDVIREKVKVIGKSQQRDNESIFHEARRRRLCAKILKLYFYGLECDESPIARRKMLI